MSVPSAEPIRSQYYGSRLIAVPLKDPLHPLVWNRYDGLSANSVDLGAAIVDSNIQTGSLIDLSKASADMGDLMDAQDNNLKHIVSRYAVPRPGITYHYLADREGRLAFGFTSDDGKNAMFRLADNRWEKCPVDLEQIDVVGYGDEPGPGAGRRSASGRKAPRPAIARRRHRPARAGAAAGPGVRLFRLDLPSPRQPPDPGRRLQSQRPARDLVQRGISQSTEDLDGFFPGVVVRIIGSDEAQKLFRSQRPPIGNPPSTAGSIWRNTPPDFSRTPPPGSTRSACGR